MFILQRYHKNSATEKMQLWKAIIFAEFWLFPLILFVHSVDATPVQFPRFSAQSSWT